MATDVGALATQLSSGDAHERAAAAEALAQLGPAARPAAAALVEACGSADGAVCQWCTAALEDLGPPPALEIPRLIALARDQRLDVAYWAITLLGRAGDHAASAVATLIDVVRNGVEASLRERAAWALGKLGPTAQAAVPALRQAAAASDHPRLCRLAKNALRAIVG